jgi:UDP-2,3-diacylglucosamine pyrophosphatase LpxH
MTLPRIAIVSDLHVGDKAREFDIRPGGKPSFATQVGYLEFFEKFVTENKLSADVLVVSGDITDRAQPSQFVHAATVIQRIATLLKVPSEHIVVVPGNHDLNWDIATLATNNNEPFWLDYRFAPFALGRSAMGCDTTITNALISPPHFALHEHSAADFWCFNSAAYDTPDRKPHFGEIREQHREAFANALQDRYAGNPKNKLRLLVTHHHLKPQPELYPDVPDFSGMVNGDALFDLITGFNFDAVFHGHKHRAWLRNSLEAGSHPIVTWCSGSFSQSLGSHYEGSIGNLWHLVEFHNSAPAEQCRGVVRSWAFAPAQGWVPARPHVHGIDHSSPFGYIEDRSSLKALVERELTTCLAARDYVEWAEVCESEPALQYQPGNVVWAILSELAADRNIRPAGERDSLDGLLILKVTDG